MSNIPNLFYFSDFPNWIETGDILALIRTSPRQDGDPSKGKYQEAEIREFAKANNLNILETFIAIGKYGRRIGELTNPEFVKAIRLACKTGNPIVALEETRFCREKHKLANYPSVNFISLTPLDTPESELKSIRKQVANKHFPEDKGGRPSIKVPIEKINDFLRLGVSVRDVAKLTGVSKSTIQRIKSSQNSVYTLSQSDP